MPLNVTALVVFVLFFALVTFVGFASVHWRKGDMDLLHEWGLAGGKFGTLITWFLLGGDIYTAYTFIAVPALAFGAGAIAFFAVPYTIIIYPLHIRRLPAAVVGGAGARLHHRGRFRARPLRRPLARARHRADRDPRDDALYRAAAGRHRSGDRGDGRAAVQGFARSICR